MHSPFEWASLPERAARALLLFVAAALLGVGPAAPVLGQGFSVYEQGTCAMGRAETGVAKPCDDASGIFYNPAALAGTDGLTLSGGLTVVAAGGDFTDDYTRRETEIQNDPIPVPHLFAAYGVTPDLAVGLGVYVPYGLETVWPADWEGAFEGYDNGVQAFYIQPTVAYRITDRITVGGGPIVGISNVALSQRLDLSQQSAAGLGLPQGSTFGAIGVPFHTAFADAELEATGATAFGGHVGVTADLTDRLHVGARFMLPMTFDYEGDAVFTQVETGLVIPANFGPVPAGTPVDAIVEPQFDETDGALRDQDVETSIELPMSFVAGVAYDATEKLTLLADYQFTGWSSFDQIVLEFENDDLNSVREENYEGTHALRFGAEYVASDLLTVRAGYLYNTSAAPDETVTPLLPESDRNHVTLGVSVRPVDALEIAVAYQRLMQNDRRGRVRDTIPGETDPTAEQLNSGLYSFGANLFGTTLTLHL